MLYNLIKIYNKNEVFFFIYRGIIRDIHHSIPDNVDDLFMPCDRSDHSKIDHYL